MNIFVGCSSRDVGNQDYNKLAESIGKYIVSKNYNLILGGCNKGLMGKVYDVVLKNSKDNIIISTTKLYEDDLKDISYNKSYIFDTVNERKDSFIRLADVAVFLPGGIGTLDELLAIVEAKRQKEHNLPIIIVNINNFFDPLIEMLNKIYNQGFANYSCENLYYISDNIEMAIDCIEKNTNP